METKTCKKCGQTKAITEFYTCRQHKDGLMTYCSECALTMSKEYQHSHRDLINAYKRKQFKLDQNRIAHRGRTTLRKIIRGKVPGYKFLVECGAGNKETLMNHLISTIPEGYTLDDYGTKLTVDHIIPVNCYDLTKHLEFIKCFNYKNLRLVTSEYNYKKGNKIEISKDIFLKK